MENQTPLVDNEEIAIVERRRTLRIATLAAVILALMWNVPELNPLLAPLRLFVTYVHEAGHALGAILTGGRVIGFLVSADGSGLATTAGGTRSVVIAAGYVGAALFGSGLFYIANRFSRWDRLISIGLGIFMVIFTFQFAHPDESGLPVANIIGYAFGAALIIAGWYAPRLLTLLILNVLAVSTALNAVLDVWYLTGNIGATRGTISNDAVAFSREITGRLVPASVVALEWAAMAAGMFLAAVYYGIWKPL
ncbi:MAG: M50 family metallopeptidase, partial [Chloroflexota bacterium]